MNFHFRLTLFFLLIITFLGCEDKKEGKHIAIANFVNHPALNAIEQGVIDQLQEIDPNIQFEIQNANGDLTSGVSIAQQFKLSRPDVIIAITTPIAQAIANQISDIPIVFAGVSDPIEAGLINSLEKGSQNVTGVADLYDIQFHIDSFRDLTSLKSIGIVYTASELNGNLIAHDLEKYASNNQIDFAQTSIINSSEIKQAVESLVNRVDAFYIGTDNTVVSAISTYGEVALEHKKPIFSADITSAKDGNVLMALGINYHQIGLQAGLQASKILAGEIPEELPILHPKSHDDYELLINLDIAEQLMIAISPQLEEKADYLITKGNIYER